MINAYPKTLLILLCLWLLMLAGPGQAQTPPPKQDLAAVLTVSQAGVELRRADTETWIGLREESVMPLGPGDSLRTDLTGRAYLNIRGGEIEHLLLPNSQYDLLQLEQEEGGQIHYRASLRGRLSTRSPNDQLSFQLETPANRIAVKWMEARGDFFLQSKPDGLLYVVVAEGALSLNAEGRLYELPAYHGIRINDSVGQIVQIENPTINPARVEGTLDGCPGVVSSSGLKLRVRAGPGDEFFFMGSLEDGSPLQLVGQSNGWYRFQFLSDFGWLLAAAISTDCQELPILPFLGVENAPGIVQYQDWEVDLLRPFFGEPAEDVWFYRR